VHECYEYLLDIIDEEGPFDGVVGFSQGAAAAATALLHSQSLDSTAPPLFKFAIFFCATSALDAADPSAEVPAAKNLLLPSIPTVHVVGQKDDTRSQSIALHELADEQYARLITHEGGHWIPKDAIFARKMQDAIEWAVLASGGGG
jgi:predicted esterase